MTNKSVREITPFDQYVIKQRGNAKEILYELYGVDITFSNARKQLAGIRRHIQKKMEMEEKQLGQPDMSEMEEVSVKQDGTVTTKRIMYLSEEDVKNPARVMFLMGYDPGEWELISCKTKRNYWDVTMKISNLTHDGTAYTRTEEPHKETNHAYTCEIVVKPLKDGVKSTTIKEIFDNLQSPDLIEYDYSKKIDSGNMLELPVMDLHLGKLSWDDETGTNWNLKKAVKIYKQSIEELLTRIEQYGIEIDRIVFPIGQDFYHFDTSDNKTTRGTPMDTDSRWQKMFNAGVECLIWAIENFRAIAPVEIMWTPGNHDTMMSYFAVHSISSWFRKTKSVNVDLAPTPRKYIRHGKCLVGFAHGENERGRINGLMQVEVPKDWGMTIYREFHLGHIHSEKVEEVGGIIIRNMGSITAIDSWHKTSGFVGAVRKMQGIIWNKERGKLMTIDVNASL